jgi:hypothetical protein
MALNAKNGIRVASNAEEKSIYDADDPGVRPLALLLK